jgi:hypothetical protein
MKGLLGFAVLTGPLWLIALLLIFGIWLGFQVAKRFTSSAAKAAAGIGTVALVLILPFADEIAGRVYLSHLCATKAGVKVYHTVELPAEYWDENGRRRFKVYEGDNHTTMFLLDSSVREDPRFEYSMFVEPYRSLFSIERTGFRLRDRTSRKVFGEVVRFMYWGGWIRRNFSPHNSATSCEMKNLDEWKYNIFKRSIAK